MGHRFDFDHDELDYLQIAISDSVDQYATLIRIWEEKRSNGIEVSSGMLDNLKHSLKICTQLREGFEEALLLEDE